MGLKSIELERIWVENLRGYEDTNLGLSEFTVLVGENNEGKSSLLKMVDCLVNKIPSDFWVGERRLTRQQFEFWFPANKKLKKARRLTLTLRIKDGRESKKFGVEKNSPIDLRFGVAKNTGKARLNIGKPKRNEKHDPLAVELLERFKTRNRIVYVNPVRDATTSSYTISILEEVRDALKKSVTHTTQGGTSKQYRAAKNILESLSSFVSDHSDSFQATGEALLSRMLKKSDIRLNADTNDLLEWVFSRIGVVLSTGDHDELMVSPSEVGNGLQSLIDLSLAVARTSKSSGSDSSNVLVIEEPEAFLHPSAQRELMMSLRERAASDRLRIIMTTHSPVIIDECRYPEVCLVRKHHFFQPSINESSHSSINDALVSAHGAEAFFSHSTILVEGPSDFAVLDSILRMFRSKNAGVSDLARIHVQPVLGKNAFPSWVELLRSYADPRNVLPIEFVCVFDYDGLLRENNSQSAVERCLMSTAASSSDKLFDSIANFNELAHEQESEERTEILKSVNKQLEPHRIHCLPWDIEYEVSKMLSTPERKKFIAAKKWGVGSDIVSFARKLGSKAESGTKSGGRIKGVATCVEAVRATKASNVSSALRELIRQAIQSFSSHPTSQLNGVK